MVVGGVVARERVIDGVLYREEVVAGAWTFEGWRANGHHEVSTRPATTWVEVGPSAADLTPDEWIEAADCPAERWARAEAAVDAAEERRERNLRGNARRARTRCRRYIKAAAFSELLTLTYRVNQTCIVVFKGHFREWCRRMKRALGGVFHYVAGFELQERGAWHAHVACHKLPSHVVYRGVRIPAWRLGTEVWRSVVGEAGGLCFVGGRSRHGGLARRRLSCAQMASYVSKYITKHYEDVPEDHKRYSRSQGLVEGERYRFTITGLGADGGNAFGEAVALGFEVPDDSALVSWRVNTPDQERRRCWLVTEPKGGLAYG